MKKSTPKQISLNDEQKLVVAAREGYHQVVAGPGSGKSACLVARFSELVKEGIDPNDIISLSFTRTAAKNLRDRVEAQVGKLDLTRTAGAVTFHSLALSFAVEERNEFNFDLAEFPLAAEPVANKLSADAARRFEVDPRRLRPLVSLWKRKRLRPDAVIREAEDKLRATDLKCGLAYKEYEKKLRENGILDFDGLIYEMTEILEKKPRIRSKWVRNFLQIDEAQDCSKIEWDLAKLLSGKSVLAVGDISQGIYGFRGSDSKLFADMDKIFPGTKTLYLGCNYRSSPEIISFIKPLSRSQDLAAKFHTPNPSGPEPTVKGFSSPTDEVTWVVTNIKKEPNG